MSGSDTRDTEVIDMTGEEWVTHWWRIYDQLVDEVDDDVAAWVADRETVEQFGPEPEDVAS